MKIDFRDVQKRSVPLWADFLKDHSLKNRNALVSHYYPSAKVLLKWYSRKLHIIDYAGTESYLATRLMESIVAYKPFDGDDHSTYGTVIRHVVKCAVWTFNKHCNHSRLLKTINISHELQWERIPELNDPAKRMMRAEEKIYEAKRFKELNETIADNLKTDWQRQVFKAHFVDGLSYPEMVILFKCDYKSIDNAVTRIKKHTQKYLKEIGWNNLPTKKKDLVVLKEKDI